MTSVPRTRCPITYQTLEDGEHLYSQQGLRRLSPSLRELAALPSTQEIRQQRIAERGKVSIGGVQLKAGAVLRAKEGHFEIVEKRSRFILKPASEMWVELPENEDLTMRLAAAAGIEVPVHGLLYTSDDQLCYVIKRFDRTGRKVKRAVEDCAQLLGLDRERKYESSMERIAVVLDRRCSFPVIERSKLFRRILVAFLTGNEDMHLKNFSLLTQDDGIVALSPAYDQVNTALLLSDPDDLALPLRGKKRGLTRRDFFRYFGEERLGLRPQVLASIEQEIFDAQDEWQHLIKVSFLSSEMKRRYLEIVTSRRERIGI